MITAVYIKPFGTEPMVQHHANQGLCYAAQLQVAFYTDHLQTPTQLYH